MKKLYILPLLAASLMTVGCSKEDGFGNGPEGEGKFYKSALDMSIKADALEGTRAEVNVDVNEFNVTFSREGATPITYKYGEMPEVVTLPSGTYTAIASYGENRQAEWENPYFLGTSKQFTVEPYKIVSDLDPIVCTLENIKVTIDFDSSLRAAMSADSYVEVRVGSSSELDYGLAEADAQKAGFFKYSDEETLVAVFHGTINGDPTVETKSLQDITKGNHYHITFRLHTAGGSGATGDADLDVLVDAEVTTTDVETNIELGDEPLLDDSERPKEDDPTDPDDPEPVQLPPTIEGVPPVDIDTVNEAENLTTCVIKIHSYADGGITAFTCKIVSEKLDEEELATMGLPAELDLVNPGSYIDTLGPDALGLLPDGPVGGFHDVSFDLTKFIGLLSALGTCEHHFILNVTDAYGTTEKTLKINCK